MARTDGTFLGAGWAFPIGINNTGNIKMSFFEQSIAEAIRIILGTSKGERVMRPDFGCEINDLHLNARKALSDYCSQFL